MVAVSLNIAGNDRVVAALHDLSERQKNTVVSSVLNDIGKSAFSRIVKTISAETGAQQKVVRSQLDVSRAYPDRPTFTIEAKGPFLPLIGFKASQLKAGVAAAPWGMRRIFPGTFIATVKAADGQTTKQVFKRKGPRLPIVKLWGPAIPREMIRGGSAQVVVSVAEEILDRQIAFQIDRQLGQVKAKYKV